MAKIRRVVKTLAVLAISAVVGIAVLIGSLWLDHTRSTALPTPTGPYKAGRATYAWTDDSRLNPYAPAAGTKQELSVWIWYPAAATPAAKTSEYLPAYWRRALDQHQGFILSKLLSRDLARVQTHSWSDADVSLGQPMYPVVILRAGAGALSTDYTSIAEDLASHGYVVVSFDAPYRTVITAFPDGRVAIRPAGDDFESMPHAAAEHFANQVMNVWIADVKFVLDKLQQLNAGHPSGKFKGRLDMSAVGIAGH
jgi:predicted dienelactone hydrolase